MVEITIDGNVYEAEEGATIPPQIHSTAPARIAAATVLSTEAASPVADRLAPAAFAVSIATTLIAVLHTGRARLCAPPARQDALAYQDALCSS